MIWIWVVWEALIALFCASADLNLKDKKKKKKKGSMLEPKFEEVSVTRL